MRPFQGKAPARFSPLLSRILERIEPAQVDPTLTGNAVAVRELSRLFTKERDALGIDYLKDPALAAAYLTYFFPVNLCKIQVLLDELPENWQISPDGRPLRVLDLGTGPGTGALAVLDWLKHQACDSLHGLTVVGVDASAEALHQARLLWTAYSCQADVRSANLVLHEGDLAGPAKNGWRDDIARRAPYDLVIVANCVNELFGRTTQPIKARANLIADLLAMLATEGTLMIVEPALRQTSRALHQLRDQLLLEKRCTVYSPCLHEGHCPALIKEHDWCHEERAWVPPLSIQQIDHEVGFIKDALKFSYLLLRTDGKTVVERRPDTFRMVSELRTLKGDTRAWLCNEQGRSEVGRLDRATSDANSAWDHCQRGAIVQIEGMKRKEGATLSRIPAEGTVEIIRPI
ncbi:MAG TPA: small ribosomal subunit Rsm22 family protein [Nitrospira sp.]|nr:small ribosomal subunit Rsm22 family protein [Nitrospira sp.]